MDNNIPLTDIRVRSSIPVAQMQKVTGKVITDGDYDVVLKGPTVVSLPNNKPLAVYLPGVLKRDSNYEFYRNTLACIKIPTELRGSTSGSQSRLQGKVRFSNRIFSGTLGYFEGKRIGLAGHSLCRQTSWTKQNLEYFEYLYPFFKLVGDYFAAYVPNRHQAQMNHLKKIPDRFVVPETPFTTISVNNTYSTGVHTDSGDLDVGFSCLAVLRRGDYNGAFLVYPQYRVAINAQDGDLILMDAHQWHGNTKMVPLDNAERISLVLYCRTRLADCNSDGTLKPKKNA